MKLKRRLLSLCLAMLMVFSLLPVYAAETEEHTHSENCYAKEGDLLCEIPESEGHTHSAECYCPGGEVLCEQNENDAHTHGANCYCPGGELLCALEETEGHTHGAGCYAKGGELICKFDNQNETGTEDEENASVKSENVADDAIVPLSTNPTTIAAGETLSVYVEEKTIVKLAFTPEEDGAYSFYSTGYEDTYGYLYDQSGVEITSNDDGGENTNFRISYQLMANTTYYWGVRYYSNSNSGHISVTLEKFVTTVPKVEVVTTVPDEIDNAFSADDLLCITLEGEFVVEKNVRLTEAGTQTILLEPGVPAGNYMLYWGTFDGDGNRNIAWPMCNGLRVILREDGTLTQENGKPLRIENVYSVTTVPKVSISTSIPDGVALDSVEFGSLEADIYHKEDDTLSLTAKAQISSVGDTTLTFSEILPVGEYILLFRTTDNDGEAIPNWSFTNIGVSLVLQEDGSLTYPDGTAFVLVNTYTPPSETQDIYVSPVISFDPTYSIAPDFSAGGFPIAFRLIDETDMVVREVNYTVSGIYAEEPFVFEKVPVGKYTIYADTSDLNLRQGEYFNNYQQDITVTENGVYEQGWREKIWYSASSPDEYELYYGLWGYKLPVTKNISIFTGSDVPTGKVSFTIAVEGVSGPYRDFYDEQEVTFDFTNYQPGEEINSQTLFFELPAGTWKYEEENESTTYRVYEKDLPEDWYNCLSGGSELITASPIVAPPSMANVQADDHSSSNLRNELPPVRIRNVYSTEVTLPDCERNDTYWPVVFTKRIALADGGDAAGYQQELADGMQFVFFLTGYTAAGEEIQTNRSVYFHTNSGSSQTVDFGYLPVGSYTLYEGFSSRDWVSSIGNSWSEDGMTYGIPITVRHDGVTYGNNASSLTVTNTYGGSEAAEDVTFDKLIYGEFTGPQEFVFYLRPVIHAMPSSLDWDDNYGAYVERITVQPGTTSAKVTFQGVPAGHYQLFEGAVAGWNSSLTAPNAGYALAEVYVIDGEVVFVRNEIRDGVAVPTVEPDFSVSNKTDDYEDPDVPVTPFSVSFTKQFVATSGSELPAEEQTFTFVLAGYRNRQDGDQSLADTFERWEQTITYTPGDEQITVSFSDVPAGRYHLIETNLGEHWTSTLPSSGGLSVVVAKDGTVTYAGESSLLVTNTYDNPTFGSLTVSKTVSGSGADTNQNFPFTVTLNDDTIDGTYGDMEFTNGVATFTLRDGQSVQAREILAGVGYTVEETDSRGYTATVNGEAGTTTAGSIVGNADQKAAFNNDKPGDEPSYTNVTVKKVWKLDDGGSAADSVKIALLKNGAEYDTVVLNAENNWTHVWDNLDDGDTWTVGEVDVPDGFTASVDQNGNVFTITNDDIPIAPTFGSLTVSKTVSGSGADTSQAFPFTVTLSDDTIDGIYGDMEFTNGVATFTLTDGQSMQARGILAGVGYTVEETDSGGYTATVNGEAGTITEGSIVGNADQKAAFNNDKPGAEPSYTSVTVKKVWKLDDGGSAADSVKIALFKNGTEYDTVVLNAENNWTHEWDNLDDRDIWTVSEVDVPDGFTASVDQNGNVFTVINDDIPVEPTIDPSEPTAPNKPTTPVKPTDKVPNTGDDSNLGLWVSLAVLAAVGFVGTIFLHRKKRYAGKYTAQ